MSGQLNSNGRLHGIGYALTIDKEKDHKKGLNQAEYNHGMFTHGEYQNGKLMTEKPCITIYSHGGIFDSYRNVIAGSGIDCSVDRKVIVRTEVNDEWYSSGGVTVSEPLQYVKG